MEKYLEMLPENVVNKIMLYNSHPVADLFKKQFEDDFDFHFNHFYKRGNEKVLRCQDDDMLFASDYLPCKPQPREPKAKPNKYCSSCDYYYPNECMCCPHCD